jgi:hypothetical protein
MVDADDWQIGDEIEFEVPEWIVEANDLESHSTRRSDRTSTRERARASAASASTRATAMLTESEYNMLLKCLHPDRRKAVEEVELKLSVQLLMSLKSRLLGLKE